MPGSDSSLHDYVEKRLVYLKSEIRNAINYGIDEGLNSPYYVENILDCLGARDDPADALFWATYISAAVAKAVFSDTEPPSELVQSYRIAKEGYFKKRSQ
ncbi:MAG: hypothetical protein QXL61_02765, partial [Archaeoglobaceae archaeon]